jgi:hypothetical protein
MAILNRWREYRPTKEHLIWSMVLTAVAILVLGFGPGGWVTGGTAQQRADEAASGARHQLAAAVCAEAFMRAADARTRLAKLEALSWWERDEHVAKAGFATMPGEKEADATVASLCATRLSEQAQPKA